MKELLARSWWMLALQGIVALLFGALALLWPGLTLLWLVALFAAYAILSGGVALYGAVKNRTMDKAWWLILVLGLVSVAAGVLAVFNPGLTALALVLVFPGAGALALVWLISFYSMLTGILLLSLAFRVKGWVKDGTISNHLQSAH